MGITTSVGLSPELRGAEASLAEIIAKATPYREDLPVDGKSDAITDAEPIAEIVDGVEIVGVAAYDPDPEWLVHGTALIRSPVYRSERGDSGAQPARSYVAGQSADGQLILAYPYDDDTELRSTLGELNCRDMIIMSALQQAFLAIGCPANCVLTGKATTLYHLARQVGLTGGEATNLVKDSLTRLHQAKVTLRFRNVETARRGGYAVDSKGQITFGFISASGFRQRSTRGSRDEVTDSFIRIDQTLGDLIRAGAFTFLKADVLRALRRKPVALKLYTWARTHEPNEQGYLLPYRVGTLAEKLGVSDTNATRRRHKVVDALDALQNAAPDEFPGYEFRPGTEKSANPVVRIRRRKVRVGAGNVSDARRGVSLAAATAASAVSA